MIPENLSVGQTSERSGRGFPLFQPKDRFRLEAGTERQGIPSLVRQISPYERAHTVGDYSYIVWTEGPKAGHVYRVVAAPTPDQIAGLKTVDTIRDDTLRKLEAVEKIEHDAQIAGVRPYFAMTDQGKGALAHIAVDLHKLYYGDGQTIGLETAQLFDLNGEGERYFDWTNAINPPSGKHGYRGYLDSIADANKIPYIKDHLLHGGHYDETELHKYFSADSVLINTGLPPRFSVQLTHNTLGNIFTNLVQLGVVAAQNYYEGQGIKKRFGGGSGGNRAYTPNDVSFWPGQSGYSDLMRDFTGKVGFEYPMIVGIDEEHAAQLTLHKGSIPGEQCVRDFAPFTHLFVPYFKAPEVREILVSHDLTDVKVLSLAGK